MADVEIPIAQGTLPAYLSEPEGDRPRPGVVVVHDAFGLTPDVRRQADWLAGAGFLAVAPDLYSWDKRGRCVRATIRALLSGTGRAFDELDATRAWLAGRPGCTGRIGVIGFCMGGGFALQLAPGHGFAAASINYGQVSKAAERLLAEACPVIGSFAGKDVALRSAPARLESALTTNEVPHEVTVYPQARHGFLNHHRPGELPRMQQVVARVGGGPHEPSATQARRRIVAFFDRHLSAAGEPA
ncbi:carboxymethylenebutenolidase [Micromonospora purpureochromogenes]|uniref:Carboxymethylenebutenolidase n=1 Tax=Micromonospora purpureochromogenes TaxID=47872 RepID=A0A1C5A834_9ACTN|nr:dienelactone hydrolase family protein [Micromonospora purpureochromogenes]SCF41231.1 carboxymethylenebutenolidase [Micromonospora purpureochromogenes]